MKHDSEIGVALRAGHPCYFVGFLPKPMPGQTIEDVCRAEALFVADGRRRAIPTPKASRSLIGNCQAGWQIMMMAAVQPGPGRADHAGGVAAVLLGGRARQKPDALSRRHARRHLADGAGRRPRHTASSTAPISCANFESLNPANTYWKKPYNVYSKVDTEAARFLEFETWWGSPVLLNAEEMQWIADNLFVGNKLTSGELRTADGVRIDLRNIRSPIIVFCSWGDNITPPQQALGWITRSL